MIEAINIKKFFKTQKDIIKAVNGVSFTVKRGEIFALLGPNGAGKTTSLRIIAGIMKPDEGSVLINGIDISKEEDKAKKFIGYLPSDTGLYPRLKVIEFIEIFSKLYYQNKIEKRKIEEVIERMELSEYKNMLIEKLSLGSKQKVLLIPLIISEPEVLILDEPAKGLDVPSAKVIEDYLIELKKKDKAILISTHVMEQAEYLADRIAFLFKGKIKKIYEKEKLMFEKKNKSLREFFMEVMYE
ncbi:MAG: ABC transporter ATP-binding protein [candidate division WOR-3 bacterium]